MFFKKNVLLGTVSFLMLPVVSHAASLVTQNNTSLPSTVKVNSVLCVGMLPPPLRVVTPPHGSSSVPQDSVNKICGGKFMHKCTADIHMTANCSDVPIGRATFDLDNFAIVNVAMTSGVPYKIVWSGTNVTINPA